MQKENIAETAQTPAAAEIAGAPAQNATLRVKKRGGAKGFFRAAGYILLALVMLAVIGGVIIFTVFMLGGSSISEKSYSTAVDLTDGECEIIDRYIAAVNAAKNESDFSLSVESASEIKDIECSVSIFQTMINSLVNSIDMQYSASESYVFTAGADETDESATPLSVIQPAGVFIEDGSYSGISAVSSSVSGESETIEFTVAAESIDVAEIMALMGVDITDMTSAGQEAWADESMATYGEDYDAGDFSIDDIRTTEEYSAFVSLVPNHTQYFDVLSAAWSVMNSFTGEDMQGDSGQFGYFGSTDMQGSGDMAEYFEENGSADSGDFSNMFSFDGGTITFGDMQLKATLLGGKVQSLSISVDFIMNMNITLMSKAVEFSYTAALSQAYNFSY
ncbi:MAG: hypothetical protein LUH82_07770 [Clostridiales bacterium]|nr:hypothetical protein [Clostridiales bacterium]